MLKTFLPQSLLGRSLLIVILPVFVLQVFTVYIFFDRHWSKITSRLAFAVAGEVALVAESVAESTDRAAAVDKINARVQYILNLQLSYHPNEELAAQPIRTTPLRQMVLNTLSDALEAQLRRPFTLRMLHDEDAVEIKVGLEGGGVLTVMCLERRLYSSTSYIFLLWMVSISLLLTLIAAAFMRNQIRPIRKLAAAAERFGKGQDAENFRPEGAHEVRQAARAFIDMRDRLKRQIEQRTAMLSGVSHDLRTPLTRLRLGLSLLPPGADVTAMQDDLTAMERMINAYLDFARGEGGEKAVATDLSQLLQRMAEREKRLGLNIDTRIDEGLYLTLRPMSVERAIGNILSNAHKYGHRAVLTARRAEGGIIITVEDDGPGIPSDKFAAVFRPFYRLDPARNLDSGGVGLGLSITQDIIQSHGGSVSLARSETLKGLKVTVQLPN